MLNAVKAYLKTEGKVDYRDCAIEYYTYSMFDAPNQFKVNVNVHIQSPVCDSIKSLALDDSFEKEIDAINFGVNKGKECVDSTIKPSEKTKATKKKSSDSS